KVLDVLEARGKEERLQQERRGEDPGGGVDAGEEQDVVGNGVPAPERREKQGQRAARAVGPAGRTDENADRDEPQASSADDERAVVLGEDGEELVDREGQVGHRSVRRFQGGSAKRTALHDAAPQVWRRERTSGIRPWSSGSRATPIATVRHA